MKRKGITLLCLFLFVAVSAMGQNRHFWLGADISGTTALEARGQRLYNAQGQLRENTALMHELGLDAVRLRVWVNPSRNNDERGGRPRRTAGWLHAR